MVNSFRGFEAVGVERQCLHANAKRSHLQYQFLARLARRLATTPVLESARPGRDGADGFESGSRRREGMCTRSEARALAMALATFGRFQFFIRTDDRGYIEVGDQCRTSAEGVWAVSA
jgi:hypothetical protein